MTEDIKAEQPEKVGSHGHQIHIPKGWANNESRKKHLEILKGQLAQKLGLKAKPKETPEEKDNDREKRGFVAQPVCEPDYVVEYVEYEHHPQGDYCYY